jgi:hypothetical protein
LRPIEQIATGDRVWARDESTGETALKPVTNLIQHREREIWNLTFDVENADRSTSSESFKTTDDHPWADASGGWIPTNELRPGMLVLRVEGKPARVASVVNTQRTQPTYNLEVADFHNYFAGEARVWVHNCIVRTIEQLLASANRVVSENGLTRAAQKLSSHAQRAGGTFPKPFGSVAAQNAQAESAIRGILE